MGIIGTSEIKIKNIVTFNAIIIALLFCCQTINLTKYRIHFCAYCTKQDDYGDWGEEEKKKHSLRQKGGKKMKIKITTINRRFFVV